MNYGEYEDLILGTWLSGVHLEDMCLFSDSDFKKANIFKQLKSGKDLFEISKTLCITVTELLEMTKLYADSFYRMAINKALFEKTKKRILTAENMESLNDISRTIDEYLARTCNVSADADIYKNLEEELEQRRNNKTAKFGLKILDEITGGIFRKKLLILSAKTSVGKSAFALQVAENVSKQNKVLYFPLEMPTTEMIERLLIKNNIATLNELRTGNTQEKQQAISKYVNELEEKGNLLFYEGVNSLEKICSITAKEKPYLVIIDQLTQVTTNKRFNSIAEQYGYITHTLNGLTLSKNVAVLLLCQISVKDTQSETTLASIKNASQISEDADNVFILEKVQKDKNIPFNLYDNEDAIKLSVAKQRFGGKGFYYLAFNPSKQLFYEKFKTIQERM